MGAFAGVDVGFGEEESEGEVVGLLKVAENFDRLKVAEWGFLGG
jgi:hypothetical protein